MRSTFFPRQDAALLAWGGNFSKLLSADPAAYGVTAAEAAEVAGRFAEYAAALALCNPNARSRSSVVGKNAAREAFKQATRQVVRRIDGAGLADVDRSRLGLTVPRGRSAVAAPAETPIIAVRTTAGTELAVRLMGSGRGKPQGVLGATIFTFVGEQPPDDVREWRFAANTTRTRLVLRIGSHHPPGSRVWVTAMWFNTRCEAGPPAVPVDIYLPMGRFHAPASPASEYAIAA